MKNKILFINACARENSRTMELSHYLLDGLNGDIIEVKLYKEDFLTFANSSDLERAVNSHDKIYTKGDKYVLMNDYDYIIGSSHYFEKNGNYYSLITATNILRNVLKFLMVIQSLWLKIITVIYVNIL